MRVLRVEEEEPGRERFVECHLCRFVADVSCINHSLAQTRATALDNRQRAVNGERTVRLRRQLDRNVQIKLLEFSEDSFRFQFHDIQRFPYLRSRVTIVDTPLFQVLVGERGCVGQTVHDNDSVFRFEEILNCLVEQTTRDCRICVARADVEVFGCHGNHPVHGDAQRGVPKHHDLETMRFYSELPRH